MRIAIVCDRFIPEARSIAHLFQDLAEGLVLRGHDVTVFTRAPIKEFLPAELRDQETDIPAYEEIAGVKVVRVRGLLKGHASIPARVFEQLCLVFRMLKEILRGDTPDIAIVYSPPLIICLVCILLKIFKRVPFVLNLHDLYPRTAIELGVLNNPILKACARGLESLVYRWADGFSVPAWGSEEYLIGRGIEREKIRLIYNWIDTDQIRPAKRDNEFCKKHNLQDRIVISYAGVLGLAQDFNGIIECARELQSDPRIIFLLIGEGALLAKWKSLSADCKNVRFLPSLDKTEYLSSLNASDICLVPLNSSLKSPAIPGKLQSIMAVGKPAVAIVPPDSDAARMVRASGCGVVVSPQDVQALTRVVRELANSTSQRVDLGEAGRRFAEQHFKLSAAIGDFNDLLNYVLAAEGRKPVRYQASVS